MVSTLQNHDRNLEVRSGLIVFIAAEKREFDGLIGNAGNTSKINWPLEFVRTAI